MKTEETKLTFYGNQAFAMLPLVGYILIGGTFSVGLHYYSMKGLSFAAAVSLFAGFFLCREKDRYWDSVVHGLAQYGNSRLIFVFMVIGIFSKLMNTGANPAMLAGALISGIFFGDAISPSSQVINTTVMIQHDGVTGQPADLLKTLRMRTPYILAAGGAAMVVYLIFGGRGGAMGDISQISAMSSPQGLWMLVPLAVLLLVCFRTGNLFMGLSFAIVSGFAVGLLTGVLAPSDIVAIDYGTLGLKGVIFEGISGMLDVVVSTILLYGLIAVAVDGGMMERCCNWLLRRNIMGTTRGSETVLTAGIVITNILLAGCVLPSILMFGGMADRIGQESGISPERRSILLTANATNFSAIIPINSAFVMGSVTIINEMVQKHSYLPTVSPFQIFSAAFYCLFLTGICVIWVVLGERAGKGGHQKAQEISPVRGS